MSVVDEGDQHEIIRTTVSNTKDFERQGDRIIMWRDVDQDSDVALSFQDTQSCRHLWSLIIAVQSKGYGTGESYNNRDLMDISNGEGGGLLHCASDTMHNRTNLAFKSQPFLLPEAKLENLDDIHLKLTSVKGEMERIDVEELMVGDQEGGYFSLLLALYPQVRDSQMPQRRSYANIMRLLILLGSPKILEAFVEVDLEILELLSTTMSHRGSSPPECLCVPA